MLSTIYTTLQGILQVCYVAVHRRAKLVVGQVRSTCTGTSLDMIRCRDLPTCLGERNSPGTRSPETLSQHSHGGGSVRIPKQRRETETTSANALTHTPGFPQAAETRMHHPSRLITNKQAGEQKRRGRPLFFFWQDSDPHGHGGRQRPRHPFAGIITFFDPRLDQNHQSTAQRKPHRSTG